MFSYKKASYEELDRLWNRNIAENPEDERYIRWKKQFMDDNASGAAATFVVLSDGDPVGEGTLLLSPACRAVRWRTALCDGNTTANVNALRIRQEFEGRGHISALMKELTAYAKSVGITRLTIGVEPCEARNLGIYLHWGFDTFLMAEEEDGALVLYYGKDI